MQLIPWLFLVPLYFLMSYIPDQPISFFAPTTYTWLFGSQERFFGQFLQWEHFVFNLICGSAEMTFNIMSLVWVHKTRKQIHSVSNKKNRNSEIKLLIQSLVVGIIFTTTPIYYTILIAAQLNSTWVILGFQYLWTANHCNNPIVYLLVNSKLRKEFFRLITCRKNQHTTIVGVSSAQVPAK